MFVLESTNINFTFQITQSVDRSDYKYYERLHEFIGKNRSHHL